MAAGGGGVSGDFEGGAALGQAPAGFVQAAAWRRDEGSCMGAKSAYVVGFCH